MSILLVAGDYSPSEAFRRLAEELRSWGFGVVAFLDRNVASVAEVVKEEAELVLVGMCGEESSRGEIQAVKAAGEAGIPYGFYADTYNSCYRSQFAPYRKGASLIFVVNNDEQTKAAGGFPNARVVVSGNPLWEDVFPLRFEGSEVRKRLEIGDDELFILLPGGTVVPLNIILWDAVLEAVEHSPFLHEKYKDKGRVSRIVLSPHPGDHPNNFVFYEDLIGFSGRALAQFVPRAVMTAPEMVAGADIVVTMASSVGVTAAYLRKPVINYFSTLVENRLELRGSSEKDSFIRIWPPCAAGCELVVRSIRDLEDMLECFIVGSEEFSAMRKKQEEIYPDPPLRGKAVRIMAETIAELLKR